MGTERVATVQQGPLRPARRALTEAKGGSVAYGSQVHHEAHPWGGRGAGGLLTAGLLLFQSKLVPNPLQGHFSHEEGDGKITLVPVSTEKQDKHVGPAAGT